MLRLTVSRQASLANDRPPGRFSFLSADERRKAIKMGDKSEAFCRQSAIMAIAFRPAWRMHAGGNILG